MDVRNKVFCTFVDSKSVHDKVNRLLIMECFQGAQS